MRGVTRVTCNPIDLEYRYQDVRSMGMPRSVHREAADPSVVFYRDRYFMFASMSRGFWHSVDLLTWEYRPTVKIPPMDYAPDARIIDGALIISASRRGENCPFFRSVDPLADDFVEVTPGTFDFWDPAIFQDDDGETYFYWGCRNDEPLWGTRIDRDSLTPVGDRVALIGADMAHRGWERGGDDHVRREPATERERLILEHVGIEPFIEGAWMTRHEGRYYLQYAAPGTQWNVYADGYFTADSPLGPFEYAPTSPFSYKPGGFITGAGHGSTFQDRHGNWWHAATMRISVNEDFERRIGIFPAGFDDDGVLFCNQNFADYPLRVPEGRFDPWSVQPEWMLLSYRSAATASSALAGHGPDLSVNEDVRTWWAAADAAPGQWLQIDLGEVRAVSALQVSLADHEVAASAPETTDGRQRPFDYRGIYPDHTAAEVVVELSEDGQTWSVVFDSVSAKRDVAHSFVVLPEAQPARFVRVTGGQMPFGARFAVSGLRVFGDGDGATPDKVTPVAVRTDDLSARVTWPAAATAQGYNVRWGISADKLYNSWQVYDRAELELRSLNAGHEYWVAVDAFNENGITAGAAAKVQGAA